MRRGPLQPWEDEDASTLGHDDGDYDLDHAPALDRAPVHPIARMQGAFEESILEAEHADCDPAKPKAAAGAKARRERLLEEDDYNESYNAQWRKKPSAKWHPLWKLVAQISFGVHLLNQQLAKSDEEVSKILKTHVQEVDHFLAKTTEDFDLALADIQERVCHLRLPLEHVNIFDMMLDDHQFRTSIVEGNEKIEKIVERTARAMNDSLVDVENGIEATEQLSRYLDRIGSQWAEGGDELMGIYTAMCGNSEGWLECLRGLQLKGNGLGLALVQLGSILNEMSKRAGVASRRSIIAHRAPDADPRPGSRSASRSTPRAVSRTGSRPRLVSPPDSAWASPRRAPIAGDKPLPRDPDPIPPAVQASLHRSQSRPPQKTHVIPIEQRFENPRIPPRGPNRQASSENMAAAPQRDRRRQKAPEPRLETPITPDYILMATPDCSRPTTPNTRSPARSPARYSPAQLAPNQPRPAPQNSPSGLRKRLSLRGRERPSSPKVDSAYSSGSSGSSRSSDAERKAAGSPALRPPSRPGTGQTYNPPVHKFGLFPPSSPLRTPFHTPPTPSIRSGVTGGSLSKTTTLTTDTRPSTSASNCSSTPNTVKRRSSLAKFRNMFHRKNSANKLGPTMESPAE